MIRKLRALLDHILSPQKEAYKSVRRTSPVTPPPRISRPASVAPPRPAHASTQDAAREQPHTVDLPFHAPALDSTPLLPSQDLREALDQPALDIFLGLDFGTVATKAVVRLPYMPGSPVRAIDFGEHAHSDFAFLLPTLLRFDADGLAHLERTASPQSIRNLKTRLMGISAGLGAGRFDSIDRDGMIPALAYLALAMREARTRYLKSEAATLRGRTLRWQVFMGIPSAGFDDAGVRAVFERVASAAWGLAESDQVITRASAAAALDHPPQSRTIVEVVPEVLAQAAGYARSQSRRDGLHLLVDVGGSTFDVCSFVLHAQHDGDGYAMLLASVDHLGTQQLHRRRLDALACEHKYREDLVNHEPLRPIPDHLDDYHPACECVAEDVDATFRSDCTKILMTHLVKLRRSRDIHARAWDNGVPVFLCGGGSRLRVYQHAVDDAHARLVAAMRVRGLEPRTLPSPPVLEPRDLAADLFDRLSVAFGLSYGSYDFGSVESPSQIDDIPRPTRRELEESFIGKDAV